jgi:aminoglycoside/choline kinase family phosphotransferase
MIELNYQFANDFIYKNLKNLYNKTSTSKFEISKIAGDASFRSYYRISLENRSFILMFAPPLYEEIKPFMNVANFLIKNGFNAPKIFGVDHDNGFLLLEDFGDLTYSKKFSSSFPLNLNDEFNCYKNACELLLELHKIKPDKALNDYNNHVLFREVSLFVDWYLPLKNKSISLQQKADFKFLWFELFDLLNKEQKVTVLRDYHADNLMIINNKNNYNSVGLLDFQDALIGLPAYDLVSLLDDIRRNIDDENRQKLYNYFFENCPQDQLSLSQDCEILSLQRNLKILGIFARLVNRDHKAKYLEYMPRVKYFVNLRLNSNNKIFTDIKKFLNYFL